MSYFVKRVLAAIPLLIGITLVSFIVMHLAPGDPSAVLMDPQITQADMAQIRHNLGLDKPLWIQYLFWLKGVVTGEFGYSFVTGEPVLSAIGKRLWPTLVLSVSSFALILMLTFPLGILSGANKGSRFDNWVMILTFLGLSIPTFWLGLILILIFSLSLGWFPTSGYLDPGLADAGVWVQALNIGWHMVLPLVTIVVGGLAGLTRYTRSGVVMMMTQDFVAAAKARGIPMWRILFKHVFKNAALPVVTILGLSLPSLIGGSFVIEYIFAWPGMGQLGIAAVFSRDYPILMGTLFFSGVLIIMGTLASDMAYGLVDPRIKKNEK